MKDPTIPDPKERKKFMFYDTEKRQVDLRIRLKYDNMSQSHFFRAMISGYLEKNPVFMTYLDDYKGKNQVQGINKRTATSRMLNEGEKTKNKGYLEDFALTKKEADELIMSARNIVY